MKKATVTYTAPKGEAKTLDIGGTTLVSGRGDTVICDDAMMARLEKAAAGSAMLKVDGVADYTPPKEAPKGDEPKEGPKTEKDEHIGKAHR
ncbi:hypothetical protein ABIB83_005473 [Bradyrhizobium sp. I1.8.5]|uniref:hypothetical protein n=1 Tax=Bradyrhizobium sp. I1.8.5 TaxID=3156365 RepID=UPI0033998D81